MSSPEPAANWLEQEAVPAIRAGIASTARRKLALDAFDQWPDQWQEAFQNAALKVWRSATARRLAAECRWQELRKFANESGHNAAIDIIRRGYSNREVAGSDQRDEVPQPEPPAPPEERPETWLIRQDLRQELQDRLTELSSLVPELPQSEEHPARKILGLYLQLLDQELKAAPAEPGAQPDSPRGNSGMPAASWNTATSMQRPTHEDPLRAAWVRLLVGDDQALLSYREQRLDLQIASILRPEDMVGPRATTETRLQAGQWVRTELSRARKRLRARYEERYRKPLAC